MQSTTLSLCAIFTCLDVSDRALVNIPPHFTQNAVSLLLYGYAKGGQELKMIGCGCCRQVWRCHGQPWCWHAWRRLGGLRGVVCWDCRRSSWLQLIKSMVRYLKWCTALGWSAPAHALSKDDFRMLMLTVWGVVSVGRLVWLAWITSDFGAPILDKTCHSQQVPLIGKLSEFCFFFLA